MGGASKLMMLLRTPFLRSTHLPFIRHSRVSMASIPSIQNNNRFYSNYHPPPHLGFPINPSDDSSSSSYGQTSSKPLRQNIEMKRGDWICHKCSFMNFAKNIKCLECEEARPKSQLTGGEWECPQCYFFNYGRNTVCVKCDCKRPGEASYGNSSPTFDVGYGNGRNTNDADIMRKLAANEEKAERWFSKVSQMDSSSDLSTAIADEDFPEIMPLRKGGNRFVVSTRKTPLERRLANAQYRRNLGNDGTPEGNAFPQGGMMDVVKTSDTYVSGNLDRILGRSSVVSETDNKLSAGESIVESSHFSSSATPPAPQNWQSKGSNSSHVSFVPLPTDRFATPRNSKTEEDPVAYKYNSVAAKVDELTGYCASGSMDSRKSDGDSSMLFGKPVNQSESKEKDQSLASIPFKRRMATEHTNNTNFVPFVPFPPDYFAKKDKQPETRASIDKPNEEIYAASNNMQRMHNVPEKLEEHEATREGWNAGFSSNGSKEGKVSSVYGVPTENSNAKPEYSQAGNSQRWNNGYSQADNRQPSVYGVPSENSNAKPDYSQAGNSQRWNNGYSQADNRQPYVYGVPSENSNAKPDYSQAGNSQRWNNGYSQADNRQSSVYGVPSENSHAKQEYSQAGNSQIWTNGYSQTDNRQSAAYGVPTDNSNVKPNYSQADNGGSWNNGYSQPGNSQSLNTGYPQERLDRLDRSGNSSQQQQRAENPQNSRDNWNHGFTGKSLEGSAVKELDPLDMSEEAKAERWFRRVAQIKDISELSNIPDEDFPEIMPMRKGVNRFVVSKRKTPLERRLTSPQYRRNLPIVSSEPPIKTENDGS